MHFVFELRSIRKTILNTLSKTKNLCLSFSDAVIWRITGNFNYNAREYLFYSMLFLAGKVPLNWSFYRPGVGRDHPIFTEISQNQQGYRIM